MSPVTPRRRNGTQTGEKSGVGRRHRADHRIMLFMGLLILVGLIVLFAISPYQIHRINSEGGSLDQSHYMLKQLSYLGIGTVAFIVGSLVPLSFWHRIAGPMVISAIVLSILLALLGAFSAPPAMCFNGACRWFDLGIVSFQPAEFLKFALVIFIAAFLGRRIQSNTVNSVQDTMVPLVVTFLNSSQTTDASSYHIDMAMVAIGSGGIFGRGLGGGVQAFGYLPEALNDSIFAVLGEIFGFIGLLIIMGLFAALLARIMRTSERVTDPTMKLLAAGAFGWIATHVVVNIGAMTGVLPLTGVTLPFLSFGGTSLLFMMATLGIVYHVSRYTSYNQPKANGGSDETTRGRRRIRGPRNPSSSRHQRTV